MQIKMRKRWIPLTITLLLLVGLIVLGVKKYSADENPITLPHIFAIIWGSPTASMTHQTSLVSFYSNKMANWKVGETIKVNDMRYYGGHTYQALQAHTSSSTTEPGVGVDWVTVWSQSTVGIFQNYDGSPNMLYNLQSTIDQLKAKPVGKRVILIQGLDGWHYMHPDDRCQNAQGTLDGLSKSPIGTLDKQVTGNDGLPSGFACPYEDHFSEDARLFTQALVNKIVAAGVDVDYLLFDTETSISEWTLNSAWETAIMQDPRWPEYKAKLDELVRLRRGYPEGSTDPKAQFPVDLEKMTFGDWSGSGDSAWKDWDALGTGFPDRGNDAIFNVFKSQWSNIKSSAYGTTGWKPNDGNFDYNGHNYYGLRVIGTHASTINYGWLAQAKSITAGNNGWHTLLFEQNQARGSVRAGYPIMPWIAFSGFKEDSRWVTDSTSPYPRTPDPYWQENIRHMVLLGADPILNFAPTISPRIEKVNLTTNTIEVYGNDKNICGWLEDFEIDNSPENNGHYALTSCANGDATNYRTRIVTSTPLKSSVAGGVVRMAGTGTSSNAVDQQTEDLLVELDAQIGTDGPRETVDSTMLDYTGNTLVTGLRHGNQVTYRVSYNRSDWSNPRTMNVIKNSTQVGTLTIPAGRIGAYYTTSYNDADKVAFTPASPDPMLTNLLPNNDFNSASWVCEFTTGVNAPCTSDHLASHTADTTNPLGENNAWKVNFSGHSYTPIKPATPITVKPNTTYILSAYAKPFSTVTVPPNSAAAGGYMGYYDSSGGAHRPGWFNAFSTKGWNKISLAITTGPTDAAITPFIQPYQVYLYDLKLTEEPPSAPYVRGNDELNLIAPTPNAVKAFTYKPKVTISGTKTAEVTKVLVNNVEAVVDNNANTWTLDLDLTTGVNTLTILGQDNASKSSSPTTRTITRRKPSDANNDGIITIKDFSSLMLNWGKVEAGNPADFNEDGSVNLADFGIMMSSWGG